MDHLQALTSRFTGGTLPPRLSRRQTVAVVTATVAGGLAAYVARLPALRSLLDPAGVAQQSVQRGMGLLRSQQYGEAMRAFGAAARLAPRSPDTYMFQGMAAFDDGQFRESVQDFSKALALRPDNAILYLYRGQSERALGETSLAAQDFRRALDLATNNPALAAAARAQLLLLNGGK